MTFDADLGEYNKARAWLQELRKEHTATVTSWQKLGQEVDECRRHMATARTALVAAADKLRPSLEREVSATIAAPYPAPSEPMEKAS